LSTKHTHWIIYHSDEEAAARTCSDDFVVRELATGYLEAVPTWNGVVVHPVSFFPSHAFNLRLTPLNLCIRLSFPHSSSFRLASVINLGVSTNSNLPHLDVLPLNLDLFAIAQFVVTSCYCSELLLNSSVIFLSSLCHLPSSTFAADYSCSRGCGCGMPTTEDGVEYSPY